MVSAYYHITMGSSTTYGTGYWTLTVPVTGAGSGSTTKQYGSGNFYGQDATGGGSWGSSTCYLITTSTIAFDAEQARANWSATVPFTWASKDQLYGRVFYEMA